MSGSPLSELRRDLALANEIPLYELDDSSAFTLDQHLAFQRVTDGVPRLIEAVEWYFSRRWGISSEALFREAMGLTQQHGGVSRPWDAGDSEGAEATFAEAPEWMRPLMQPRMDWYREIARLGWPADPPDRAADGGEQADLAALAQRGDASATKTAEGVTETPPSLGLTWTDAPQYKTYEVVWRRRWFRPWRQYSLLRLTQDEAVTLSVYLPEFGGVERITLRDGAAFPVSPFATERIAR